MWICLWYLCNPLKIGLIFSSLAVLSTLLWETIQFPSEDLFVNIPENLLKNILFNAEELEIFTWRILLFLCWSHVETLATLFLKPPFEKIIFFRKLICLLKINDNTIKNKIKKYQKEWKKLPSDVQVFHFFLHILKKQRANNSETTTPLF